MRKVRIGIDVGGTFTDAVAIDNSTYEIIAQEKIPTTHKEGVAQGIITVLQNLMTKNNIAPEEIIFIAHGTTQATNALLEGDVATAGILAMGSGIKSDRVKKVSDIGNIPLAHGKELRTVFEFVETEDAESSAEEINHAIDRLKSNGAEVVVATEVFGVDDIANEKFVVDAARAKGLYATAGYEVSKLYGMKVRTRTAVVNGSLIPRMMETADMTESCVKQSGISSPLMIMRCDGGVMTVDEVRRRPILTMLSGLAAGVAGVLMYEKLSDGIFLESGGTSTDISVIKDGRVMVRYGEIGGHKMYLSSLDVRTIGVAGGSMIRVEDGKITDVGPRSAHIAGLPYEVFSPKLNNAHFETIAPKSGDDKVYAAITDENGNRVSLTLTGAANVLGVIPKYDYAYKENPESARAAWQVLGDVLGCSAEEAARQAMDIAAQKIWTIVDQLIKDYKLSKNIFCLVGGGGSCGVVVPYLGNQNQMTWKIVRNAPIISTIGVALAMIREVSERTVVDPTEQDIKAIRREVLEQIMKSGADESTVEIEIEIDKKSNTLRAVATGASEMKIGDANDKILMAEELQEIAAKSMNLPPEKVKEVAAVGKWHIFDGEDVKKILFFFPVTKHEVRVLDRNGVVTLQREGLGLVVTSKKNITDNFNMLIEETSSYDTIGESLPNLFAYFGEKQLNLSGMNERDQIISVLETELDLFPEDEQIILLAVKN
ncbi:MAG: hydantoinase/oxoprolinase family protein [Selenomonadaceae bacterium]|nr:hydantoinase/oxoprolinase family protein [Selenomonadaceae bacterium]